MKLMASGELFHHLRASLQRALTGFVIGGSLGILAGIWIGFLRNAEKLLQ